MDKTELTGLWDAYGGVLTPTQRELCDLYFNYDLTVSEIAEEKKISRQAVSECLQNCKKQFEELEEKLGIVRQLKKASLEISFMLTDVMKWADGFLERNPLFGDDIASLKDIILKGSPPDASAAKKD